MNATEKYKHFCKPKLTELLAAIKLDLEYETASGNYLYTKQGRPILDCIGGFGATLLGHNHPELVDELILALKANIPSHAQTSIRGETARLAEYLNQLLPTDQEYFVNFTNSGTESIEAAIKHAYKVHFDKVRREYERICRVVNDFYHKVDAGQLDVILPQPGKSLTDFRDDLEEYNLAQFEAFQNKPVMVAFKGSFHGKSTSALKVTFNKSYREAFEGLSAIETVYLSAQCPERFQEVIKEQNCTFYYPLLKGREVILRPILMTRVIGLILEVIQGEGGIRPLPEKTLAYLASHHKDLGVPLIIDEIQTGCGRLGQIYAYTDTALAAIAPEYITISKALGGGLVKIGATLIRQDIYDQDFGILHTSTFCEDELSSRVAFKFLKILTRNEAELLRSVASTSDYLKSGLLKLQSEFPNLVHEVRGGGLMLGMEFTPLDERSPFFRASGKQGVLSLLIASYLLEYHNIRLLAPLSTMLKGNPGKQRLSIIRIQPPVTITVAEIDKLLAALSEVLTIIENNNEYCLIAHLTGICVPQVERESPKALPVAWPIVSEHRHIDARTGFIVHPPALDNLIEYYFPSFQHYAAGTAGLKDWWGLIGRFLEPIHVRSSFVSSNDFVIENNMVFVPYFPDYMTAEQPAYLVQEMRDKIQDAVTVAKELGDDNIPVCMVGLGAYTSIITRNGETINDYEVPITTGNAYTTALTILGISHAAERQQVDLKQATVAIVGAAGNIGSVIAQIMAPNVGMLYLVGSNRKGSAMRLEIVRQSCWTEVLRSLAHEHSSKHGQIAQWLARFVEEQQGTKPEVNAIAQAIKTGLVTAEHGKLMETLVEALEHQEYYVPIQINNNLDSLADCDVVVTATSSANQNLIQPDLVNPGAIVCCASVPSNLSPQFGKELNRNLAFNGGLARLPDNSIVDFVGMPRKGLAYGCLAETFLMGFDGRNHSFCKSVLTIEQVHHALQLADQHGFCLGELTLDNALRDAI